MPTRCLASLSEMPTGSSLAIVARRRARHTEACRLRRPRHHPATERTDCQQASRRSLAPLSCAFCRLRFLVLGALRLRSIARFCLLIIQPALEKLVRLLGGGL